MSNQPMHQSSINFQNLVENLNECVWTFDLITKKFLYISPSIYQLRGLTVAEAMQESLEDCLTIASLQKLKNTCLSRYQHFLEGDRSDNIVYDLSEYEQYCKDGSIKSIEVSTRLEMNANSSSVIVIGVSRDITKRKLHEMKLLDIIRNQQKIINAHKDGSNDKPVLFLHFFGKFRVFSNNPNKPIKWRTTKTEELFAFLLQKEHQYISKAEIMEALWPELDLKKSSKYLHTTIYNLKKDLKSADVLFQLEMVNGFYCFDSQNFYSDLCELRHLIKTAVAPYDSFDPVVVRKIERAILIYDGDYLSENDYPWASTQSAFYRKQFENYTFDLAKYYFLKHDYLSTKRVLDKLISIDNLNETYHELLLNVFIFDDDYLSFVRHYDHLKALLQNELGQLPNGSIRTMNEQYRKYAEEFIRNEKAHF